MSKKINIYSVLVLGFYLLPLAQSITTIGVYLNNLTYISNQLCINKDATELHCEGTCVLAQMMNDENSMPVSPFRSSENSIQLTEILGFIFIEKPGAMPFFGLSSQPKLFKPTWYNFQPISCIEWPPESLV